MTIRAKIGEAAIRTHKSLKQGCPLKEHEVLISRGGSEHVL